VHAQLHRSEKLNFELTVTVASQSLTAAFLISRVHSFPRTAEFDPFRGIWVFTAESWRRIFVHGIRFLLQNFRGILRFSFEQVFSQKMTSK